MSSDPALKWRNKHILILYFFTPQSIGSLFNMTFVDVPTHLAPAGSDLLLSTLRNQGTGPSEFFPTVIGMNG